MKKIFCLLLCFALPVLLTGCGKDAPVQETTAAPLAAEAPQEDDFSPYLWFMQGGVAPEETGAGVVLWLDYGGQEGFLPELVPEEYHPQHKQDVGYVVVAAEGKGDRTGYYKTRGEGVRVEGARRAVELIAYHAGTGAEVARSVVYGGDPPETLAANYGPGLHTVYGDWPAQEEITACAAALCARLAAEKPTASPWTYRLLSEEDAAKCIEDCRLSGNEARGYMTLSAGVMITGYSGYPGGALIVPETLEGQPVVAVGKKAFAGMQFDEIVLPDTVTFLAENAFAQCDTRRIRLSDAIAVLPYYTFDSMALEEVALPSGLKAIGYSAFGTSPNLAAPELPEGLAFIAGHGMPFSYQMKTLTLPESLNALAFDAFAENPDLTLRVWRDSWAHRYFTEGGWQRAMEAYAHTLGKAPEELAYHTPPMIEIIDRAAD